MLPINDTFKTLTLNKLDGSGHIHMNTNIVAQIGDLVVAKETYGNHTLSFFNEGSEETSVGTSLKVVDVSSPALSQAKFTIKDGGFDVGAYMFELDRGEAIGKDAGDWYLYNAGEESNLTKEAKSAVDFIHLSAFAVTTNLQKRFSDLRLSNDHLGDVWIKAYNRRYKANHGTSTTLHVNGLEIGADRKFHFEGGRIYAGGLMGLGKLASKSRDSSSGELEHQQLGAYTSLILDNGSYVDLAGRYFWFERNANVYMRGSDLQGANVYDRISAMKTRAISLDLETGRTFDLPNNWYVDPHLGFNWLSSSKAHTITSLGDRVTQDDKHSLTVRAGVEAGYALKKDNLRQTQVYGRLDFIKDVKSNGEVIIDGHRFKTEKLPASWMMAVGIQSTTKRHNFYVQAETDIGSKKFKQDWGLSMGARFEF